MLLKGLINKERDVDLVVQVFQRGALMRFLTLLHKDSHGVVHAEVYGAAPQIGLRDDIASPPALLESYQAGRSA